jgi:hypothetical protein
MTIQFRLSFLVLPPLLFTLFFVQYTTNLSIFADFAWASALLAGAWFLYSGKTAQIRLSRADMVIAGGLTFIVLIAHAPFLAQPLGGDELYHAERSAFIVHKLQRWAESYPNSDSSWFHASRWRLFDARHIPVATLFRAVTFSLFVCASLAVVGYRQLKSARIKQSVLLISVLVLAVTGSWMKMAPENHPPLRLLPWVLGQLAFGLGPLAFRLPATLVCVGSCIGAYLLVRRQDDDLTSRIWSASIACLIAFIPVVFYVSEAVEPSVFGFAAWLLGLLFVLRALRLPTGHDPSERENALIYAGICATLGTLSRQPVVVLWLGVGVAYVYLLWRRQLRFHWLSCARIFAAGITAVPYFLTVKRLGHVAGNSSETSAVKQVLESLHSGIGPMSVLNSTTIPWAILAVVSTLLAIRQLRFASVLLAVLAGTAYSLYYSIWPFLWGIGRYQAEYVAPFIAIAMLFGLGSLKHPAIRLGSVLMSVWLMSYTLEINRTLNTDTAFAQWPRMRVTTTAYFPYDEAISYVQRAEANGHFAIVGGSPIYGQMVVWPHGLSFSQVRTWRDTQEGLKLKLGAIKSAADLATVCKDLGIQYLLVQHGSKRERQHRTPSVESVIGIVEDSQASPMFVRDRWYQDVFGGIIDVYRVR